MLNLEAGEEVRLMVKTYLDSCFLITAFQAKDPNLTGRAIEIIEDPNRMLIVSDAVWLEVMPKPHFEKQPYEKKFYEAIFEKALKLDWRLEVLFKAHELAKDYGIAAMDAIHLAFALSAEADIFVTGEKSSKPMFRLNGKGIQVYSIRYT